jgi:hypothetical protein
MRRLPMKGKKPKPAKAAATGGPTKPYYSSATVGAYVQVNYDFLEDLWADSLRPKDAPQTPLREYLFSLTNENALRAALLEEGIPVPSPIRIMLVDLERAKTKQFGSIDHKNEFFYVLVLPPVPRRDPGDVYREEQAWWSAHYHASNDGYGM